MTVKRNFKRRVRERQARTGERYTTARRRLQAERTGAAGSEVTHSHCHHVMPPRAVDAADTAGR